MDIEEAASQSIAAARAISAGSFLEEVGRESVQTVSADGIVTIEQQESLMSED